MQYYINSIMWVLASEVANNEFKALKSSSLPSTFSCVKDDKQHPRIIDF